MEHKKQSTNDEGQWDSYNHEGRKEIKEKKFKRLMKVKVAQSSPTLCHPVDYTIHRILQARILEWVAVPFSRESSQTRDWTQVSHIAGEFFTSWATRDIWDNIKQTNIRCIGIPEREETDNSSFFRKWWLKTSLVEERNKISRSRKLEFQRGGIQRDWLEDTV